MNLQDIAGVLENISDFSIIESVLGNQYSFEGQNRVKHQNLNKNSTLEHDLFNDRMNKTDLELIDEIFTLNSSELVRNWNFDAFTAFDTFKTYIIERWNSLNEESYFDQEIDKDHEGISYIKQQARMTNSSQYYVLLGNIYMLGSPKYSIKVNKKIAIQYFKEAAYRGSQVAMYNLGLLYREIDPVLAFKYTEI